MLHMCSDIKNIQTSTLQELWISLFLLFVLVLLICFFLYNDFCMFYKFTPHLLSKIFEEGHWAACLELLTFLVAKCHLFCVVSTDTKYDHKCSHHRDLPVMVWLSRKRLVINLCICQHNTPGAVCKDVFSPCLCAVFFFACSLCVFVCVRSTVSVRGGQLSLRSDRKGITETWCHLATSHLYSWECVYVCVRASVGVCVSLWSGS